MTRKRGLIPDRYRFMLILYQNSEDHVNNKSIIRLWQSVIRCVPEAKGLINSMKMTFFRPTRLSGDTICTRGNPVKRGNFLSPKDLAAGPMKNGLRHKSISHYINGWTATGSKPGLLIKSQSPHFLSSFHFNPSVNPPAIRLSSVCRTDSRRLYRLRRCSSYSSFCMLA
jgi:hypothetical protein